MNEAQPRRLESMFKDDEGKGGLTIAAGVPVAKPAPTPATPTNGTAPTLQRLPSVERYGRSKVNNTLSACIDRPQQRLI